MKSFCSKVILRTSSLVALVLATACATAEQAAAPLFDHGSEAARVLALPDAQSRLRADTAYLSDDKMEGREAGTRGYDAAADYVAARMKAMGLTPGNNGSWFQDVTLRDARLDTRTAQMSVVGDDGERVRLKPLGDFKAYPSLERDMV